ncbi:MAG TPA: flagellar assembly protein FliW [Polyangiaceae bacterium]|jgi:flagellar assembly factor FliW|nr:flagellar assembly protein FliW [Polyangiaceae bacterium]
MIIQSQRFGAVEFADEALLTFPGGVIGFPHEHRFVLIPHKSSSYLAWLQSVTTPALAFPVVSAHAFGTDYSDLSFVEATKVATVGGPVEECAVMVVLCAPPLQPATVNLLAPVVVNLQTRQGAQVILEDSRYSTREPFIVVQSPERMPIAEPLAPALASGAV